MHLQGPQPRPGQGHGGSRHRGTGRSDAARISGGHPPAPDQPGELPGARACRPGLAPGRQAFLQHPAEGIGQGPAKALLHGSQGEEEGGRVGFADLLLQLREAWQGEQQGPAVFREGGIRQDPPERIDQLLLQPLIGLALGPPHDGPAQEDLARVPAGEGIAVAGQQVHHLPGGAAQLHLHRRREVPQHREGGRRLVLGKPLQHKTLLFLVDHEQVRACSPVPRHAGLSPVSMGVPAQMKGQRLTRLIHQPEGQGDHQGHLLRLARGGGGGLANQELQGAALLLPAPTDGKCGGSCLAIPMAELPEIKGRIDALSLPALEGRLLKGLNEVFAGGGSAVMALHVETDATHEHLLSEQAVQGADHFRALFIDRGGVKIVNCFIVFRLHWMGGWSAIFPKLGVA